MLNKLTSFFRRQNRTEFNVMLVTKEISINIPIQLDAQENSDGTRMADAYMFWKALAPYFTKISAPNGHRIVIQGNDALIATQTEEGWKCSLPGPGTRMMFETQIKLEVSDPSSPDSDCSSENLTMSS